MGSRRGVVKFKSCHILAAQIGHFRMLALVVLIRCLLKYSFSAFLQHQNRISILYLLQMLADRNTISMW